MWELMTEYEQRGIAASSYRTRRSKIKEEFSLGIFFGTYESRGLLSTILLETDACENAIIILFKESKEHKFRQKNDAKLLEQVRKCCKNEPVVIRNMSVRSVEDVLKKIFSKMKKSMLSSNSSWFIDMAGSPKPYYLGICAYVRRFIDAPSITLFHATGDYEKGNTEDMAFSFTDGFDRYMWIPYLWGRPDRVLPWTYFFLLGFEGDRSVEIYDRFEPEYTGALIGKPGYKPNYVQTAKENNALFLERAKPKIIYADAADAIATWKKIQSQITRHHKGSNVCFVPLGPKPHALGAGLTALSTGTPAVLYLMPRSYSVRDIRPGEYCWMYKISF